MAGGAGRGLVVATLLVALGCRRPVPPLEPLPGAADFSPALKQRLATALVRRGPEDAPRTHHRRPDGSPRYTNRLILESSPYLLQHAHNPVDWYPWGEEALARARAESKPVLLSVGYSTCHWCHVMEEESFEDVDLATYLNANYVAIKVDREERPDLDATFMTAVETISGRGGWPMTVWLTPGGEPFYGGTYFPLHDGDRGVRLGFLTLLRRLRETFDADPLQVAAQADAVTARVRQLAAPAPGEAPPRADALHAAYAAYAASFDTEHGGFGAAPKFPTPVALDFLLHYQRRTATPHALEMVTRTLEAMAAGGVYDQVGGGFHRYATDAAWLIPHFEKMLADNAQLAVVYLDAFQVTHRDDFRRVTRDILDYVGRDMTAPEGGFYTATDADSDGEEGRFFVWTPAEIVAVLDPQSAVAITAYFGVTAEGNFAGRTVLHAVGPPAAIAAQLGMEPARLATVLEGARSRLRAARATRVPPRRDTKVLTAWNGLMITAFARAGAVLDDPGYVARARAAASCLLDRMRVDGRLRRSWAEGSAHEDGFLEDYAFLAAGLLDLYEATFDARWLSAAIDLHATLARDFWDEAGGGFFATASTRTVTLAREKPADDTAVPSGNAVAAATLLRLAELTGDDQYRQRAEGIFRALAPLVERTPTAAARLLTALDFALDRSKEIVIVRAADQDETADLLLATVRRTYLPNHVLTMASESHTSAEQRRLIPLLEDKRALRGVATAYVCEQHVCATPTSDPAILAAQLATAHPLPAAD